MHRGKRILLSLVLLLAAAGSLSAQGDTVHSYRFSTGVDSLQWITLDNPVSFRTDYSVLIDTLPFTFFFCNCPYSRVFISSYGYVAFDGSQLRQRLAPVGDLVQAGYYAPEGTSLLGQTVTDNATGSRIYVLQFHYPLAGQRSFRDYQVQLREADNSVAFVYGPLHDNLTPQSSFYGMMDITDHSTSYYYINTSDHTAATVLGFPGPWPGAWRHYRFTPLRQCISPTTRPALRLSGDSAELSWTTYGRSSHFLVRTSTEDAGGVLVDSVLVDDTICTIPTLPDHCYYAYVYAICSEGDTSLPGLIHFDTPCKQEDNKIDYSDIYASNVTCRYGSYYAPSIHTGIVDHGSASADSRHTVMYDRYERDQRTNFQLCVVPENHCTSVRLGNWYTGMEQEEIDYVLQVDTNDYDLLILRYALVEQDPSHPTSEQPKFILDITDDAGNLIGNCYHGNFVSGDNSGWNTAPEQVLWRDWQAVGVDLAPLHGQRIHVRLSNYDCAQGGHYGYAYFTLDSDTKSIRAMDCGDVSQRTFVAPEGFGYRWYSQDNPSVTLSTTDTLHVSQVGRYYCQCTYNLSGQSCGFTLSIDAFGRYPKAAFASVAMDSCGIVQHFVNQSVVARDSSRTQLTAEPCESCLWDFGDGTTSTEAEPSHRFTNGDYRVTLYAMLSNGVCTDSVSHWVHSDGYDLQYSDTAVLGEPYTFGSQQYYAPGIYSQTLSSTTGCDSVQTLCLSSFEQRDSLACVLDLPAVWWGRGFVGEGRDTLFLRAAAGTDSIVALHLAVRGQPQGITPQVASECLYPPYYTVSMPEGWRYTWNSDAADAVPDSSRHAVTLRLRPSAPTTYYYEADYADAPSCPVADSLRLDPLAGVQVRLLAEPDKVTDAHPEYRVSDLDSSASSHVWLVDDMQQSGTGSVFSGVFPAGPDSIRVTAVGYSSHCSDTAEVWIKKLKQTVYFPNVFTPEAADNRQFRGYGTNLIDYQLEIWTKWGDCFFRSHDIDECWDGTQNGHPCPASAYIYVCRYTTLDGNATTLVGTVLLVR